MAASDTSRAIKTTQSIKACLRQRLGRYHAALLPSTADQTSSSGWRTGSGEFRSGMGQYSTQPRHGLQKFGQTTLRNWPSSLVGTRARPFQLVGPTFGTFNYAAHGGFCSSIWLLVACIHLEVPSGNSPNPTGLYQIFSRSAWQRITIAILSRRALN